MFHAAAADGLTNRSPVNTLVNVKFPHNADDRIFSRCRKRHCSAAAANDDDDDTDTDTARVQGRHRRQLFLLLSLGFRCVDFSVATRKYRAVLKPLRSMFCFSVQFSNEALHFFLHHRQFILFIG